MVISRSKIAEIIRRDAETSRPVWFDGPPSFTALAARDREELLGALRSARAAMIATLCLPATMRRSGKINPDDAKAISEFLAATVDLT